ncbi:MAG: AsnC family transcriptional regulator [Magnetospirillum sp.]|nr:AsnC family transcriptional regulator [Magnetospirillum sp.]
MTLMDDIDRRLLSDFQRGFPLEERPFAVLAERLGISEDEVIRRLDRLRRDGAVSRLGAVVRPNAVGASTLAAMAVPPAALEMVAALVSAYAEVNHNYQRDHRLNLWFVVAADSREQVAAVLEEITLRTGIEVLDLPMMQDFHIDLGFPIQWN